MTERKIPPPPGPVTIRKTHATPGLEPIGDVEVAAKDVDARYWSVTTIIKAATSNAGLVYWKGETVAKEAVRIARTLPARIKDDGEKATVEWLMEADRRDRVGQMSASKLGTAVHDECEYLALNGHFREDIDPEVRPFVEQFDRWLQRYSPTYIAAEMPVYSDTYGYAGTTDFIFELDGVRLIGDYKTSRKSLTSSGKITKPYPEVALQLAAYRNAELAATWQARRFEKWSRRYYLMDADERALAVPVPAVDGGVAIHITPDHCDAYPVQCGDAVFDAFTFAIEMARWNFELSRDVIGPKLEKAEVAA